MENQKQERWVIQAELKISFGSSELPHL